MKVDSVTITNLQETGHLLKQEMSGDFILKSRIWQCRKARSPANQTYRGLAHLGSIVLIFSTNPSQEKALSVLE